MLAEVAPHLQPGAGRSLPDRQPPRYQGDIPAHVQEGVTQLYSTWHNMDSGPHM